MLGKKHTPEARAKISAARKGQRLSDEHRAKLSAIHTALGTGFGDKNPMKRPEVRAKVSAAKKGRKCPPFSAEHCAKLSAAKAGSRHPLWLGGISREPYAWTFNEELKEEVRRRDGYKCQLCGVPQAECERKLQVHHIDYDKKNSDPANLILLCLPCHGRTNVNRAFWMVQLQRKILEREEPS